jgi:hypothetical protein
MGISSDYELNRFALPVCAAHLCDWRFVAVDLAPLTQCAQHGLARAAFPLWPAPQ